MSPSTTAGARSTNGPDNVNSTNSINGMGDGASGLLQTLQGHVDDIRSLLQCGICVKPLYEPFTIACGHTFCYSCLSSWFSSGRSNKTCPDCRAPVKAQPAPAYLIRSVVQMFTSRAELLDKNETTAQHERSQREEAEKVERDKRNTHPREGGLFRGTFNKPIRQAPIIDVEDNVIRCPRCSWELEDDAGCAQCGYLRDDQSISDVSDSVTGWTEEEENSEMTDYYDDEVEVGFGGGYRNGWDLGQLFHHLTPALRDQIQHLPSVDSASLDYSEIDDYDDGDEDADMDSFIDDDEHTGRDYVSDSDISTVVGGPDRNGAHYDVSQFDTDSSMSHTSDDEHSLNELTPTGSSVLDQDEQDDEHDEDDDDDDEPVRPPVNVNRRRREPTYDEVIISVQHGSSPPRVFTSRTSHSARRGTSSHRNQASTAGSSAHNAISVEDDSDEGPVGPSRRARNRRGCRVQVY
ncbi:hypothetical protein IFM46972_02359 [Aspergillus udagawae]|uniref:RING-type domain-containing protein n=1 Tax=Aspergillus udagawae TaxID=91492 RepID=A0A8E0QXJ0_9EURO|nr:uncharacterized protein Aud_007616 [Aspergillus udagawae]GFF28470.1 hypothetical protein IFM46972_02359 [Aspergillus udagawae]GIC91174.1 hypothetical protein Aud_007616 [Aspergillus udagawae]